MGVAPDFVPVERDRERNPARNTGPKDVRPARWNALDSRNSGAGLFNLSPYDFLPLHHPLERPMSRLPRIEFPGAAFDEEFE